MQVKNIKLFRREEKEIPLQNFLLIKNSKYLLMAYINQLKFNQQIKLVLRNKPFAGC